VISREFREITSDTYEGKYKTNNGGDDWQRVRFNLPENSRVQDIFLSINGWDCYTK